MSQPGSKPRVVRREKAATRRPQPARAPEPSVGMYMARTSGGARGATFARIAGALAVLGAVLLVVADFVPYARMSGEDVTAGQDVASILAHVVLLGVAGGAGALMLAGRGGRVGAAMLAPFALLMPGTLLQVIFDATDEVRHDGLEYYFGELYTTAGIEARLGWTLTLIGVLCLLAAGVVAAVAWSDIAERDVLPLGGARGIVGGAAGLAALLAVTALLVPAATPRIAKYTDSAGFVFTRDLVEPHSAITTSGLSFVGGVLLLVGWVLAAASVGAMTSRVTSVAALVGLGGAALYEALRNLRDVIEGPDLVVGPRLFLLLGAAVVALGAAVYAARVRKPASGRLLSE